jgi:hypothetical protein
MVMLEVHENLEDPYPVLDGGDGGARTTPWCLVHRLRRREDAASHSTGRPTSMVGNKDVVFGKGSTDNS